MYPPDDWTRVTAVSHPLTYAAFETIKEKHHEAYNVPPEYSRDIPHTEQFLSELNEEDRHKLCDGDYDPKIISFAYEAAITVLAACAYYDWPVFFVRKRKAVKA